jgi:hypothetical protein
MTGDATEKNAGTLASRPKNSVSDLKGQKYNEKAVGAGAMEVDERVLPSQANVGREIVG